MIWAAYELWRRELLKFVRDGSRVGGALLQPLVVWLLLGFGFRETFRLPGASVADVPYLEFLFPGVIALIALFTSIFSTISIVEERQAGFLQGALAAPIPRSMLILGTTTGGATLAVLEGMLFIALLPLSGHTPSIPGVGLMLIAAGLIGIGFTALGVVIAWRTKTTRGFHAVMNLFLIPLWVLSGAFFPAEGASDVLAWIIKLNPISYGVDAIRHAMYLPAAPPIQIGSIEVAFLITAAFAVLMCILAVRTVNRPLTE